MSFINVQGELFILHVGKVNLTGGSFSNRADKAPLNVSILRKDNSLRRESSYSDKIELLEILRVIKQTAWSQETNCVHFCSAEKGRHSFRISLLLPKKGVIINFRMLLRAWPLSLGNHRKNYS